MRWVWGLLIVLGLLQMVDIVSTTIAINGGATELNPMMRPVVNNLPALIIVKGLVFWTLTWMSLALGRRSAYYLVPVTIFYLVMMTLNVVQLLA